MPVQALLHPGPEGLLLLDDLTVAQTVDCRQVFHAPAKDPANPILAAAHAWEGRGPYTWGTRLLANPETGEYDLFYVGFRVEDNHYRWGLASSVDGLQWSRRHLGVECFDGQPAANMLSGGPHPDKAVRAVVRDPRPECPASERYKGLRFTYDGAFASYSPDGRRWTEDTGNPVWSVPSDVIHTLWDPHRACFVAYYKVWEVTGETPDAASPTGYRPITIHLPSFEHHVRPDGLTELRGPMIAWDPTGSAAVRPGLVLLRTGQQGMDDGGGGPLTGAWHSRRVTAWADSHDWRRWAHERVVLRCDERDRPDANIQCTFVFPWGGYYLALLTLHDERGHFEQQFAFSHDGLTWQRPWRGAFIGLGAPGAFDCGMVLSPTDPVVTPTQMLFYYGGFNTVHHAPMAVPWTAAIGRAILRRDGFSSWENLPGTTATVTTQPLAGAGSLAWVNADASAGWLRVEVLDEHGRAVPGYEAAACQALCEDTASQPQCRIAIRWDRAPRLPAGPIRLRFHLHEARLFSCGITAGEGGSADLR